MEGTQHLDRGGLTMRSSLPNTSWVTLDSSFAFSKIPFPHLQNTYMVSPLQNLEA